MAKTDVTESNFEKMDKLLIKFFEERETRVQAEGEIQSVVDHKVLETVLDNLPDKNTRDEFMTMFAENSDDGTKVKKYLDEKGITAQVEAVLQRISQDLVNDLRHDIEINKETGSEGKVPVK